MESEDRPDATRVLAELVATHPHGNSSVRAETEVKRAMLDLLGVTLQGAHEEAGRLARNYARAQGGDGPSAIIGGKERISPTLAALANGTAGHALDFDDIGLRAGHVSVSLVPAAVAAAELVDASGPQFIDAMIIGYEVAHRLTMLNEDDLAGPYEFGYHKPSVFAVFGATAACCRLLGLQTRQVQHAFGIAASQSGGLRINFGTMTKPFHAGISNRTGVEAALLAKEGFTSSDDVLEGRFGWFDVICRKHGDLNRIIESIGDPFAVEEGMRYKLYPSCGANHSSIDAVLTLMAQHGLTFDDVKEVNVTIESTNLEKVLVYPWPKSGLQGKFSLAYNVAGALVDGAVTVTTFTDAHLPTLAVARDRIRVHSRPDMSRNASHVRIRTFDGRDLERNQLILRGSLEDPFSWDDLVAKFHANTTAFLVKENRTELVERIANLEREPTIGSVTDLLLERP
jgi:2-methylcitrate dehydratase PrpD